MNVFRLLEKWLRTGLPLVVFALLVCVVMSVALAGCATGSNKADSKSAKTKLTGAQLYAVNCNRCHPERYPTEWTSAQWSTILVHMRVRANLPAKEAKEILKYLQEDSGN